LTYRLRISKRAPHEPQALARASLRCGDPLSPNFGGQNGGSGGARTRIETLQINGLTDPPSQIASQISGVAADLQRIIDSWPKLSQPLKAAILAIVTTATKEERR